MISVTKLPARGPGGARPRGTGAQSGRRRAREAEADRDTVERPGMASAARADGRQSEAAPATASFSRTMLPRWMY